MEFNDFFVRLMVYIKTYIPDYVYDINDFMIMIDSENCKHSFMYWKLSIPEPTLECIENVDACHCEPMPDFTKPSLEDRIKQLENKIIIMQEKIDSLIIKN